jgi:hypothetical protein
LPRHDVGDFARMCLDIVECEYVSPREATEPPGALSFGARFGSIRSPLLMMPTSFPW